MATEPKTRTTYLTQGWWRHDQTILDDVRRAAREHPHKAAFICQQEGRTTTLTYRDLVETVDLLAGNLARLGVQRKDVITLQLPNGWQLNAMILACARIGAVANPIVPIMRRREVEYMMRLTESPMYVAASEFRGHSYADMAVKLAQSLPNLRRVVVAGGPTRNGQLDFDTELLQVHPQTPDLEGREARPDDLAQIMFTSGTTGEPKGVMHSHNTLYAMNKAQAEVLSLTFEDVTAMGSPTTHQAGYTWNLLMPLMLGSTSVHLDRWEPALALDLMQRHSVTFFMGAPTFLSDLIDTQRQTPRDLTSLRVFATGSAPIPPVLVEQCAVVLGCRLYALWGMTENGCVTVTRPHQPSMRASLSDGTPVPGMEVRIISRDSATAVASDEVGLLQVRGAGQCLGYYRRGDVYDECVTDDGWFDTGDLARSDGFEGIRIAGRVKDVIIRGAENIPTIEVEGELLRHPDIKDVALIGYPDARLGERACAVVVTTRPLVLDDITEHLATTGMAKQYWPERLELRAALPRTPSGKIQKFLLRQALSQEI